MSTVARVLLRLITLVLGISIVVFVLVGGFWYVYQDARNRAPQVGYTITMRRMERAVLGIYLRVRGEEATGAVDPHDARDVAFAVEPGDTMIQIAQRLEEQGLIHDAALFRRVVQYQGIDAEIESGVYVLRRNMTMNDIALQLRRAHMPAVTLTIPEGWRAEEIAQLLEDSGVTPAREFLEAVAAGRPDYPLTLDRPEGAPPGLEGYLFPDTYQFPLGASPDRVLDTILQNFERRVSEEMRAAANAQGWTLYEVLTLASIVEREAVLAEERPLIAGVYRNRLEIGMYLQADPTVQYAKGYSESTGRWWNPMLQEEAQTADSPYNTFLHPGLPPGPICNPGLASIRAVLDPEPSSYFFFYHKGDGSHAFAETFEEHLRNQELYGAGQ